jgi:outer membrane protein
MKKIALLIVLTLTSVIALHAQLFVGGGFGFDAESGSEQYGSVTEDKPSEVSFSLNPQVGFMLSDDFAIGAYVSFGLTRENDKEDHETINKSSSIAFSPFARYYAFRINKFSVFMEALASVGVSSSKTKFDGDVTDGPKTTEFSVLVFPGMSYDISNRFQLMAHINAFGLGINHEVIKNDLIDYTGKSTNVGFEVNMNSLVTTGYITIGAIIKL